MNEHESVITLCVGQTPRRRLAHWGRVFEGDIATRMTFHAFPYIWQRSRFHRRSRVALEVTNELDKTAYGEGGDASVARRLAKDDGRREGGGPVASRRSIPSSRKGRGKTRGQRSSFEGSGRVKRKRQQSGGVGRKVWTPFLTGNNELSWAGKWEWEISSGGDEGL